MYALLALTHTRAQLQVEYEKKNKSGESAIKIGWAAAAALTFFLFTWPIVNGGRYQY